MTPQIERAKDDVILLGARVERLRKELRQAAGELKDAIARLDHIEAALDQVVR